MIKHSSIKAVYDNDGETIDRYSIYAKIEDEHYLFCSSSNPFHPMGVWSMLDNGNKWTVGDHLGEEIEWDDLPEDVQKAVLNCLPNEV